MNLTEMSQTAMCVCVEVQPCDDEEDWKLRIRVFGRLILEVAWEPQSVAPHAGALIETSFMRPCEEFLVATGSYRRGTLNSSEILESWQSC